MLEPILKSYIDLNKKAENAIQIELEHIRKTLLNGAAGEEDFIIQAASKFQDILTCIEKFHIPLAPLTISQLNDTSTLIQAILDATENISVEHPFRKPGPIPHPFLLQYENLLSPHSINALKTAENLFTQSQDWQQESIDLSPIINMYCKTIELSMRDLLQPHTDILIHHGELSRRLENLGYYTNNQEKMQEFEDYIGNLPIIRTIPYFSKFKLRKILRALCVFRPGKRFTLDGPKAFALFLLVVGRKECFYQFHCMLSLPFQTDAGLFEFIKQVHILQDNRNKAVHEGLTWEASETISNMRKQAYSIINACIKIGSHLGK
jgi:hypothetical protein